MAKEKATYTISGIPPVAAEELRDKYPELQIQEVLESAEGDISGVLGPGFRDIAEKLDPEARIEFKPAISQEEQDRLQELIKEGRQEEPVESIGFSGTVGQFLNRMAEKINLPIRIVVGKDGEPSDETYEVAMDGFFASLNEGTTPQETDAAQLPPQENPEESPELEPIGGSDSVSAIRLPTYDGIPPGAPVPVNTIQGSGVGITTVVPHVELPSIGSHDTTIVRNDSPTLEQDKEGTVTDINVVVPSPKTEDQSGDEPPAINAPDELYDDLPAAIEDTDLQSVLPEQDELEEVRESIGGIIPDLATQFKLHLEDNPLKGGVRDGLGDEVKRRLAEESQGAESELGESHSMEIRLPPKEEQ